jgi:hypothetical protein
LEHRASVKRFVSLEFVNLRQSVTLVGRGISPKQGWYLYRTTQTQNKRRQTSMPWVGFETTIPEFERAKIFHGLDRAAIVNGMVRYSAVKWSYILKVYFKRSAEQRAPAVDKEDDINCM